MDQNTRLSIITAAVTATGPVENYTRTEKNVDAEGAEVVVRIPDPGAYQAAIHDHAISIAVMASETSQIAKSLASIENAKVFSGTVISVKKEQSSTRGVITLHTGTDRTRDGVPEGCEQVRTDRTDNALGLAMAKRAKGLIGHRVLVWVEVEEYNGGQGKVRVLKHVESLGVDAEHEQKITAAA